MSFFIFKNFIFSIYLGILVLTFSVFAVFGETSNKSLTEIFKPQWPHEAFWAIPSIDQIKPRLAIKTATDGRIVGRSRCVEVDNLEQRRLYNKLAKMKNEQLHRVACKSMKLAIREIDYLPIFENIMTDVSQIELVSNDSIEKNRNTWKVNNIDDINNKKEE